MSWWTPKPPTDAQELVRQCDELGVSWLGQGDDRGHNVPELQRRLLEARRAVREHRLWLVAVFSMVIAVIAAAAAWVAVVRAGC